MHQKSCQLVGCRPSSVFSSNGSSRFDRCFFDTQVQTSSLPLPVFYPRRYLVPVTYPVPAKTERWPHWWVLDTKGRPLEIIEHEQLVVFLAVHRSRLDHPSGQDYLAADSENVTVGLLDSLAAITEYYSSRASLDVVSYLEAWHFWICGCGFGENARFASYLAWWRHFHHSCSLWLARASLTLPKLSVWKNLLPFSICLFI